MGEQPAQTMLNAGALRSYVPRSATTLLRAPADHPPGRAGADRATRPGRNCSRPTSACCSTGDELLQEEVFGPATIVVEVADQAELLAALQGLRGQLTATLIGRSRRNSNTLPTLVAAARTEGRPRAVQRLSHRRGSLRCHGPRRALPGDFDARGTSVGRWRSIASCVRCVTRIVPTACCRTR